MKDGEYEFYAIFAIQGWEVQTCGFVNFGYYIFRKIVIEEEESHK